LENRTEPGLGACGDNVHLAQLQAGARAAFAVLLGAELNAEVERQTARDTTQGPDRPAGRRGARMADTVGEESRR
jgi:hypothetical protein